MQFTSTKRHEDLLHVAMLQLSEVFKKRYEKPPLYFHVSFLFSLWKRGFDAFVPWISQTNIKERIFTDRSDQIPMASRSSECWDTGTKVLATMAPLAATAGTPIPGKVESPQQNNCGIGVEWPGNVPCPALMAGPYVPLFLLRNLLWDSGVPTNFTSHFSRSNPGPTARSTALHITLHER